MNLHISNDEKFLDPFIVNAENYTNSKNVYIVITKQEELNHVKTKNVITCKPELNSLEQAVSSLDDFERVYFHSFSELFSDISFSPVLKGVKKYLLFYGFEVFGLKKYELSFYLPKTKAYVKENKSFYFTPKLNPIEFRREVINYRYYGKQKTQLDHKIITALSKFDYIGHFIEEDVKAYIQPIAPNIKWINWNFFGKNVGVDEAFKQDSASLNTLLLGNSASPFNNHIEALEYLADSGASLKIMAPLSYSGSDDYIKKVVDTGAKNFKNRFIPLTEFLPMKEYYKLMQGVKAAVFFNLRSQAAGNILWLLTHNIPVFMLEQNNLYKMLTRSGVVVYSIERDLKPFLKDSSDFTAHLENEKGIEEVFGEKEMGSKYRKLLELYFKD